MRTRLLLLGVLGVLMTLAVAGAAVLCLGEVAAQNRELATVTRALHYHQHADMMHDALRADVARAQLAGLHRPGFSAAQVRTTTDRHASRFRKDLNAIKNLRRLPPRLHATLTDLYEVQAAYVHTSVKLVDAALSRPDTVFRAQADNEVAFRTLTPLLEHATRQLMHAAEHTKDQAKHETSEAIRMIGLATAAALAGWLALVAWHNRSMLNLQGALVREAEQRSAAELLQRSLLPTSLPDVRGVAFAARTVPGGTGQQVGGDWYDVLTLPTGEVCLVVGDVAGHDLPAAAVMGQVRNALRAYALEDPSPTTILGRVNRAACLLDASDLTTCICVVLDPATMTVRWSSAGHPPPLALSAAGRGRLLDDEPGPPLGVDPAAQYEQHETRLRPGQTLLLYTDGLVERRGATIDDGLSALQGVVVPEDTPEAMCDQLLSALPNDTGRIDDVTCLLLHVEPQPPVGAVSAQQDPAWGVVG